MTVMPGIEEHQVSEEDNGDIISLTSLKLTIALSFFGMVWSIALYILSTKWRCIDNQTLWETNVFPTIKTHWENYVFPTIKQNWPRSLPPKSMHTIDDAECMSQYSVNTASIQSKAIKQSMAAMKKTSRMMTLEQWS